MAAVTFQVQGALSGALTGNQAIQSPQVLNANATGQRLIVNLANGDNTITIPANTRGILVQPPTTNTNALKVKNVGGDSGMTIDPASPFFFVASGNASFVINSTGATNGVEILFG